MIFLLLLFINCIYFFLEWVGFKPFAENERSKYELFEPEDTKFPEFTSLTKELIINDYIFSAARFGGLFLIFVCNFVTLFCFVERTSDIVPASLFIELTGIFCGSFFGLAYILNRWHDKDQIIN